MHAHAVAQTVPAVLLDLIIRLQDGRQTRALHAHAWHLVMGVFKKCPELGGFWDKPRIRNKMIRSAVYMKA
jgi:hypothetical protein